MSGKEKIVFKIILFIYFGCVSVPAFGGGVGCILELFSRGSQSAKRIVGLGRGDSAQKAPGFYSTDDALSPRGLANSRRQQFVIGGEDSYFILDGEIVKKSLLADEWQVLDGLSGATAVLFHKGSLFTLTESRQVYRLEWLAEAGHEWILHNENVIKMFLSQSDELVFLLGTSKERAAILAEPSFL